MNKLKEINGKLYQDAKVVMLPTNEKSNLILEESRLVYCKEPRVAVINGAYNQHLYIISDEEIKEGDWSIRINPDSFIVGLPFKADSTILLSQNNKGFSKIIATTDSSLKNGPYPELNEDSYYDLPSPSQSFIEKYISEYNKGNVITDVLVEYEIRKYDSIRNVVNSEGDYFYDLKVSKDNTITIKRIKDSWNREEVVTLCMKIQYETTKYKESCHYGPNMRELAEWTNNWIEQNL